MPSFIFLQFDSWRKDDWWAWSVVNVPELRDGIHSLEDALKVIGTIEPTVHRSKLTAFTYERREFYHAVRYTGTKPLSSWRHANSGSWYIASEKGIRCMIGERACAFDSALNQCFSMLQEEKERIKNFIGKATFDGFPEEDKEEMRSTPAITSKIVECITKFRSLARRSVSIELNIKQSKEEENAERSVS